MTNQKKYPEPTVGGLILNDKKQIFLAKSHKWKNRWTVPGGHIELGEKVEEALKREIEEETGLEIEPLRFLLLQEAIYSEEFYKPKHFIFLDYLCKAKTADVKVDKDEMQDFVWIEPRKALEMNIDSFTKKSFEEVLGDQRIILFYSCSCGQLKTFSSLSFPIFQFGLGNRT